jgi:tetratricopeptide (TPR) repeat protein
MINQDKFHILWVNKVVKLILFTLFLFMYISLYSQPANNRISKVEESERAKKINSAINEYKELLKKSPNDRNLAQRLISLLFREQRFDEVLGVYNHIMGDELKQERNILSTLGKAYYYLGKENKAVQTIRSIISSGGKTKSSYLFAGNVFMSMRLYNRAEDIFEEGRRKWGGESFARELFYCYKKEKKYKKAIRELFYLYRGQKGMKGWIKKETIDFVEKDGSLISEIEKIAGKNEEYGKIGGEILLELGELRKAKRYLIKTMDAPSLLRFASVCVKNGYYGEAEDLLSKVLDIYSVDREKEQALYMLAGVYVETDKFDKALEKLDMIIDKGEFLEDSAIICKSEILIYNKKEFKKGVDIIKPLLEKNKYFNRDKILEIGVTGCLKSGNYEEAEIFLRRSSTAFSIYLSGEIVYLKENYDEAKDSLLLAVAKGLERDFANDALERVMVMETLQKNPSLLSLITKVDKALWKEDYDEALSLINKGFLTFEKCDEKVVLLFYKGKTFSLNGRINDAISSYLSIVGENEGSPFSPKALFRVAILYKDKIGDEKKAEEIYKRIIYDYSQTVEAEMARGELELM